MAVFLQTGITFLSSASLPSSLLPLSMYISHSLSSSSPLDLVFIIFLGYPDHHWETNKFQASPKLRVGQKQLERCVKEIFPEYLFFCPCFPFPSLPIPSLLLRSPLFFALFDDNYRYEIIVNARKEVGIVSPETGLFLEIDVWIPLLRVGFEYQVWEERVRE